MVLQAQIQSVLEKADAVAASLPKKEEEKTEAKEKAEDAKAKDKDDAVEEK